MKSLSEKFFLSLLLGTIIFLFGGLFSVRGSELEEQERASNQMAQSKSESTSARLIIYSSNVLSSSMKSDKPLKVEVSLVEEDYQPSVVNNSRSGSRYLPLGTTRGCQGKEQNYFGEVIPLFDYENTIQLPRTNSRQADVVELSFRITSAPQVPIHLALESLDDSRVLMLHQVNLSASGQLNIELENLRNYPGQYVISLATYCQNNPQWYLRTLLISSAS